MATDYKRSREVNWSTNKKTIGDIITEINKYSYKNNSRGNNIGWNKIQNRLKMMENKKKIFYKE